MYAMRAYQSTATFVDLPERPRPIDGVAKPIDHFSLIGANWAWLTDRPPIVLVTAPISVVLTDFEALTDIGLPNRVSPIPPPTPHRHLSARPIEMPYESDE